MPSYADLENEVWVGAGAAVTMIPESHIYLGASVTYSGAELTKTNANFTMVPDIYVGCTVKIHNATITQFAVVKSNTETKLVLGEAINTGFTSGDAATKAWILPFGAPCPGTKPSSNATRRFATLSDNWLGLVNTFSPPSIDVELAQLSLALAGTRNLKMQYKKAETVSGASLDTSMSHGAWFYYTLGRISAIDHTASQVNDSAWAANDIVSSGADKTDLYRVLVGDNSSAKALWPPTNIAADASHKLTSSNIVYTFAESNGQDLPSFSLELTYEKEGIVPSQYYVGSNSRVTAHTNTDDDTMGSVDAAGNFETSHTEIFSRVFTGCQVNSMTLNFEESQEVKQSLDLVTRRAFDVPNGYHPKRGIRTGAADNLDEFQNFKGMSVTDKLPYMFSQGELKLFGSIVSKVKSGSVTISNNIAPQRYIGNYNSEIISQHIPANRTYEVSLTMLITDTDLWNDMRASSGENLGAGTKIELKFSKDGNFTAGSDYFILELQDFITQSVDIPFPDDKGPLEVTATFSARTLANCQYSGDWVILNQENN